MKIKATLIINMGLYQDIRPEIEIEVPDNLSNKALVEWLHTEYKDLLKKKEEAHKKICERCGGISIYSTTPHPMVGNLCERCAEEMKYQKKDFEKERSK